MKRKGFHTGDNEKTNKKRKVVKSKKTLDYIPLETHPKIKQKGLHKGNEKQNKKREVAKSKKTLDYIPLEIHPKMKRKSLHAEGDEKIDKKKKVVRFKKIPDDKPIGKNIKTSFTKKTLNEKNLKLAKHNATKEKIHLLKLKKENELGQTFKGKIEKRSDKRNLKLAKNNASIKKTDWVQLKKERKELREKRRARKLNETIYDKINEAKRISEKLRRLDCTKQNRKQLIRMLNEILQTHYSRVIFAHDMSRIIQCMIRYCEDDVRQTIFSELKPFITQMLQSKYAKNCIKAALKYGSREIKTDIISTFYGNIVKLMCHSVSAPLIELTYSNWCTDLDKIYFKQEFYGFMYKQEKDKTVKSLQDVFKTASDMKLATLSAVKANLVKILNKGLVNSTLLHTVLWEFFCVCSTEDKNELIVMLRPFVTTLSQTKMGAKVAVQCIWHGNNKDRKVIIKAFKENVKEICMSKDGYVTLLALFDSADDTVMMKKVILSELQQNITDIALNEHGRHVILYLVARRDPRYFPPTVVKYLHQGDDNSISKKPADIREKELLEAIRDPLLNAITADAATWLSNSSIAMVTLAILKVGSGKKLNSAFESIAKFVSNENSKIKENDIEYMLVDHSGLHVMLKKLIQNDKELLKRNESTFAEILISHLTEAALLTWIEYNRACYLLNLLIKSESENVHTLLSKLKPLTKCLKSKSSTGASILLTNLKG